MSDAVDNKSLIEFTKQFFLSSQWVLEAGNEKNEKIKPALNEFMNKYDGFPPHNPSIFIAQAYMLFLLPKAVEHKKMEDSGVSTEGFIIEKRGDLSKPVLNRIRNSFAHAKMEYDPVECNLTLWDDNHGNDVFKASIHMMAFSDFILSYYKKFIEIIK